VKRTGRTAKAGRTGRTRTAGSEAVVGPQRVAGLELRKSIEATAAAIRERLQSRQPKIAIVLGSGLGFLTEHMTDSVRIHYQEIPGFPTTTVIGHGGELVAGRLAGKEVLAQSGRFHLYEGHDASVAALPVRAFSALGIETVVLTNAAGGIRRTFSSGTVMLIADHINLTFRNPLTGPILPGEERFPDMSDPYDRSLRALARQVALERRIALDEGVYVQLLGPSYETPAEIRMLDGLGADAVGMSTVVEVIAARARGLRCLGFSVVTNLAAGISPKKLDHVEVLETANRVRDELAALVEGVIKRM
jgi:purine-nucleoside phosphorylase